MRITQRRMGVGGAGAGHALPIARVKDLAPGVDHGQRGHDQPLLVACRRAAHAALDRVRAAQAFADGRARARAHRAFVHRPGMGRDTGGIARVCVGAHIGASYVEVEENGRGHNRHFRHAHVKAVAALLQPAHDAIGRGQTERAAACQRDGMNALHQAGGIEQRRFARARRAAAHIHPSDGPGGGEDHRAAGACRGVRPMADQHTGNIGQTPTCHTTPI